MREASGGRRGSYYKATRLFARWVILLVLLAPAVHHVSAAILGAHSAGGDVWSD
jgi:hypothetical protein